MEESSSSLSEAEMENQTRTNDGNADDAAGAPNEDELAGSPMETDQPDMNESGSSEQADKADESIAESKNYQGGEGDKSDADIGEGQKEDLKQKLGEEDGAAREYKTRRSIRRVSTDESVSRKRTGSSVSGDEAPKKKLVRNNSVSSKQEGGQPKPQQGVVDESHDKYCWVCHKEGVIYHCKICPRSFHPKCISLSEVSDKGDGDGSAKVCVCPECTLVMKAENVETRSDAMKSLSQEDLGTVLQYICKRLKNVPGVEPFLNPVKSEDAEDYHDFIVYPMDIHTLEKNISQGQYGSTEAFMSDAQWIVHNSIVFNSVASVYTHAAKKLLKVCKQELTEIETCPECYKNAHEKPTSWFVEACTRPHLLVWAKLKGFPFWPAKAMKIKDEQVDVRFFGEHDRAWVKLTDCLLYMVELPYPMPNKKIPQHLANALDELNQHAERLKETFGEVTFATEKQHLGPNFSVEQIRKLIPQYNPESKKEEEPKSMPLESKYRLRTTSKDSKSKADTSDSEPNSGKQDESAESDSRVPDGEILASALGLTRINKTGSEPQRKSTRLSSTAENVHVKAEPDDIPDDNMDQEPLDERRGTKAKNLMEQISNQTQAKPGYRFNISKDISISAIEDNEGDSDSGEVKKVNRFPPGATATNQLKGVGNQRFVVGKDGHLRPLVKGSGVAMKPPARTPMQSALQPSMRKAKDGSYQPLTGDGSVTKSTPQPQGAITLPGGSITVTPLSSSGRPAAGQGAKGANGLPMNGGNNPKFGKALRAQQQITRNFGHSSSSTLPPSARILVQNCLKACEEQLSSTITAAIAEIQPSTSSGKGDSAGGDKEQLQRLQQRIQRYEKEVADLKHGHSVVVKELKTGYEKRMAELKRMYEQDKARQAAELKKKQWCANCGREAMFYCCWNTSYCDYACQEEHWPAHMTSCSQGQNRNQISNNQAQLQNGR